MRAAFLILNHRGPDQLVRLLTALRSQLADASIVVHHDAFNGEIPASATESISDVHVLRSGIRVTWGDYSLVDVCTWSLRWMQEHLDFDWVVVLSAQDYPIKPLDGLADSLARKNVDAVFAATPIDRLTWVQRLFMHRRYFFHYDLVCAEGPAWANGHLLQFVVGAAVKVTTFVLNNSQPLWKVYRLPDKKHFLVGSRARATPFGPGRQCWYGSSWFAVSQDALKKMLAYISDHPEYEAFYRHTMNADESALATIVCNLPGVRVGCENITYTRWSQQRANHPDTFGRSDLSELLAAPQYFARKFDIAADPEILDALDQCIKEHPQGESTGRR